MNQPAVILFDGICNLCCGWVKFLIRWDKKERFMFASLQSKQAERILKTINLKQEEDESIVYIKGNLTFIESTAVLKIFSDLGGIWKLFAIFNLIPLKLRDSIYLYIARKRYNWFGKRSACLLPTAENQKRFLT